LLKSQYMNHIITDNIHWLTIKTNKLERSWKGCMGDTPPLTRLSLRNVPIVVKLVVNIQHKQHIDKVDAKCYELFESTTQRKLRD